VATSKKSVAKAPKTVAAREPEPAVIVDEAHAETAPAAEPAPLVAAEPFEEAPDALAPVDEAFASEPDESGPVAEPAPVEAAVTEIQPPVINSPEVTKMSDVNNFVEAPLASFTEAQGKARSLAATSLTETRAKFSQFKSAASEAASAFETSYATVKNGAIEINTNALEALKATADANFDFVKSVFAVKSPSEYVTLHTEFARKQIETLQTNAKAFGELAQKIATQSAEPIKAQVAKTFSLPL